MRCRTLGLTGTIGSGKTARVAHVKSLVTSCFITECKTLDVEVISADHVGHRVYAPGTDCYHRLLQTFGNRIIDRSAPSAPINRRELGRIVFSDKKQLELLNSICWPIIEDEIRQRHSDLKNSLERRQGKGLLVLLEAALLAELPRVVALCDDIWVTFCDRRTAVRRVMSRDALSEEEATRRVSSQSALCDVMHALESRHQFIGEIACFDTAGVSLKEGLDVVSVHFEKYLRNHIFS